MLGLKQMSQSRHNAQVKRSVLLWVTVTLALWAALPLTMYLSHWQWFGWMPRFGGTPPAPRSVLPPGVHSGSAPVMVSMVTFLVMSSVVMAVVLWVLSLRPGGRAISRD
jgi:hypothetical protein